MKNVSNFSQLWDRLKTEAELSGDDRMVAVLMNHERKKEYICRRLGVISDADVTRVAGKIRAKVSKLTE